MSTDKLPRLMKDMNEPQLRQHLNTMCGMLQLMQTVDALGFMIVIFQDNGLSQYGSTVDPETAPAALRELADRIERRETVTR